LKNLERFDEIPQILNEPIFQRAFNTAKLANLTSEQRDRYEQSLLNYRDWYSIMKTALEERDLKMQRKIAQNMMTLGLDDATIATATGLNQEQIQRLRREHDEQKP
jgi:hypothetical protein